MPEGMKDFLLHKLTVRVVGFSAVFLSTKAVNFISSERIYRTLSNFFVDAHLKPGAETWLRGSLEALITICGAVSYHFIHDKFILPNVSKQVKGEENEKITVVAKPVPTTVSIKG